MHDQPAMPDTRTEFEIPMPARPEDVGPIEIDLEDAPAEAAPDPDHYANLAESLPAAKVARIGRRVVEDVERDIESRRPDDERMRRGISLLGLDRDDDARSDPFPGASAVNHPLLAQSITEFNARIMREIFQKAGPVKAEMVGRPTPEKLEKAGRVDAYARWLLTSGIQDYREDTDRLMFALPLFGSVFRKVYWRDGLPHSETILPGDFAMPATARSMESSPRKTHVLRLHPHEVRANVSSGLWRDVEIETSDEAERPTAQEEADRLVGLERSGFGDDDRHVIFECHCRVDVGEGDAPYVVTVDSGGSVLAIRRNWEPDDAGRREVGWFVHYKFLPSWSGPYGLGLYHLIGGLSAASTGALRALMDSAAVNTMPAGVRIKGTARGQGNKITLEPFSFSEIELPPNIGKIGDAIIPFPVNPPSPTLFQLLEFLVSAGTQFASVATQAIAEANEQAPVGTTLALVEQHSMVFASIHSRQHASLSRELEIMRRLLASYLDEVEAVPGTDEVFVYREDFAGDVMLVPVSDPSVFSSIQRTAQAQALLQLAQTAQAMGVQIDGRAVAIHVAGALQVQDAGSFFPEPAKPEPPQPMSPAEEVRACLTGQPAKAHPGQDHQAHIAALVAATQIPALQPALKDALPLFQSLIADHTAALVEESVGAMIGIGPGAELPPEALPQLAVAQAQAILALKERLSATAQEDPAAATMAAEVARKRESDAMDARLEAARLEQDGRLRMAEIESRERIAQAKLSGDAEALGTELEADVSMEWLRHLNAMELEQLRQLHSAASSRTIGGSRWTDGAADLARGFPSA